jgi:ABC-type antimicrobial peptide transport system permease subunit
VGVARDGKYDNLRNETVRFVYVCTRQQKDVSYMYVLVRTAAPPQTAIADVRREMASIDSNLAIWDVKTMESHINETLFAERIVAALCACFGALATLLAAIGLYGVTAFSVARRTREIGIRMALGAGRSYVLGMVLKEVALLCVLGLGIGVPVALALGKVVETQLYGVAGRDWLSLTIATVILLAVSLAAGFLPARRAASVDPTIALRYE